MENKKVDIHKNRITLKLKESYCHIQGVVDNIVRVVFSKENTLQSPSYMIEENIFKTSVKCTTTQKDDILQINCGNIKLVFDKSLESYGCYNHTDTCLFEKASQSLTSCEVKKYTIDGTKPIIKTVKTVDGERNFVENAKTITDRMAYKGEFSFKLKEEEALYGLGQHENGIYNYRGHMQYLYQHNMKVPIPFLLSSRNYGILFDCTSLMSFKSDDKKAEIYLDTVDQIDYYIIHGKNIDEIMAGYRKLTGKAVMLPRWTYGYVQSKERYKTEEELLETALTFRQKEIPLDCIVQDWKYWEGDLWGNKILDKSRYPHLSETVKKLHEEHIKLMISVWPNVNHDGENHTEFMEKGMLLGDYSTYDAFKEEARAVYWKQAEEELFSSGLDAWWCDSTEPFAGPDWCGISKLPEEERYKLVGEEHKKFLDAAHANIYALMHTKGMYEYQRKADSSRRVVNLTRSGSPSQQKYGTILWSGDISASWDTLRKQITEGLNFCMSGMPYWTLDIGAFFAGSLQCWRKWKDDPEAQPVWFWNGNYDKGVHDLGYRELYVRWLQYGAFLPMMRSHGTDTPREPWHFGEEGNMFYDTIIKFIKLRYKLLPYIYSLGARVHFEDYTMMRSLLFDFAKDKKVKEISDEFMLGDSILVCPVTTPMYYDTNSKVLEGTDKTREIYLPKGTDWYDFWTNKRYRGGQSMMAEAPIEKLPVYIKAGAIIPTAEDLNYADEVKDKTIKVLVYLGADGEFTLYDDDGDNYSYEEGQYVFIRLVWKDKERVFEIENAEGLYPFEKKFEIVLIDNEGEIEMKSTYFKGARERIQF